MAERHPSDIHFSFDWHREQCFINFCLVRKAAIPFVLMLSYRPWTNAVRQTRLLGVCPIFTCRYQYHSPLLLFPFPHISLLPHHACDLLRAADRYDCGSTAYSVGTVYGGKRHLSTPGFRPALLTTPSQFTNDTMPAPLTTTC